MKRNLFPSVLFLVLILSFLFSFEAVAKIDSTGSFDVFQKDDLSKAEYDDIARFVFSSIKKDSYDPKLYQFIARNALPRFVILSVSDGRERYLDHYATGKDLRAAVEDAVSKIPDDLKDSAIFVTVSIAGDFKKLEYTDTKEYLNLDPGIDGIYLEGRVFLPSRLLFGGLLDSKGRLSVKDLPHDGKGFLATFLGFFRSEETEELYKFTTLSLFTDGIEVLPIYRGHGVFRDLNKGLLRERIDIAADYLADAVEPSGKFRYSYQPEKDRYNSGYNILRHCGTVYSMLEIYEISGNGEILEKAELAIDYLVDQIREDSFKDAEVALVEEGGSVKLGGNGLAIVALAKYSEVTGNMEYLPVMQRMAKWMELTQKDDGNFSIHKMAYPSGKVSSFISSFYPGEAILSLVRLYSLDRDPVWLEVAEKASKYLINVRDRRKKVRNIPHDHWLLYGLSDLYRYRKDPLFVTHSLKIADGIISCQNRNSRVPDWNGGYYSPPGSTPTATRTEGLCAAFRLALDSGHREKAEQYLEAIKRGVVFQLNTQIGNENAWFFPAPGRALGGFRKGLTESEIRIDYVQHNISALKGLLGIMDRGEDYNVEK
jgi:hypothetical protein